MKIKSIMTTRKAGLAGLLIALGIGGCAPIDPETGVFVDRATPQTASMHKQINVQRLTPVFVAKFTAGEGNFTDIEKGRLLGFAQAQQAEFGDVLQVELPPFSDAAGLNEARYGAIGSFLEDEGFKVVPKVARDGLVNSLRVYFTKYVATVDPECSKGWHKPVGNEYENLPLPHMGCSTASGFAQMVAYPKDLVAPGTMGAYNGERASLSILKYREGASSDESSSSSSSSNSSSSSSTSSTSSTSEQ